MPSTWLLLLAYLTYLALGSGVFWLLESPAAHDSSERFQRDKWALLRNFTCLDDPALDSLIRVRGERGGPGAWWGVGRWLAQRSAGCTGMRREGTHRLGSGQSREHFSKRKWRAQTRGRTEARVAEWGLQNWAGPRWKEPSSGESNAQRGATSPRFGARGRDPPCPESCVAHTPESGDEDDKGRANGVQSWLAGPTGYGRRRDRARWPAWEVAGGGRPGTVRRCVDVGPRAKGEGAPLAPSTGDPGANLRIGGKDGRQRWAEAWRG